MLDWAYLRLMVRRQEAAVCAVLALAAVGAALVSQHHFDMQPCPWCVLQRLVFVALAGTALIEWVVARTVGLSGGIAAGHLIAQPIRHLPGQATGRAAALALRGLTFVRSLLAASGLAAAMWQHFVASASASCNLTWADRFMAWTQLDGLLPDIFQPRASCLDAKAWIFGVPYELWSAALFVILGLLALRSLRASRSFTGSSTA